MQALAANQDRMRDYFKNSIENMGGPMTSILPFTKVFDEMGKQNIAMFERTLRMFGGLPDHQYDGEGEVPTSTTDDPRAQLAQLQNQLSALAARLDNTPTKDD
jgi:polyhydroxyalkanoate synthesis regulator protein